MKPLKQAIIDDFYFRDGNEVILTLPHPHSNVGGRAALLCSTITYKIAVLILMEINFHNKYELIFLRLKNTSLDNIFSF